MAARFSDPGMWGYGFALRTASGPRWTGKVEVQWERLAMPLTWRKPAKIFASSTSDWFHQELPIEEIATLTAVAVAAVHVRDHTIQILTKRADRMRAVTNDAAFWDQVNAEACMHVMEYTDPHNRRSDDARRTLDEYGPGNPPPGIWFGVSVEDQQRADERIPDLLATPAAVRFLSCEPLLGPISLREWFTAPDNKHLWITPDIHWVIAGGESGPRRRAMDLAWMRSLRVQCFASGVPFFGKQDDKVRELPEELRIRQFPARAGGA